MEEFYNTAKDADYLIYNAAIDNPISSIDELIEKNALFADFKAVKNDNVWCTEKNMFQATDSIGSIINDFHTILTDNDAEELEFVYHIH
jgi:iron complex transport system substrate-binding protein